MRKIIILAAALAAAAVLQGCANTLVAPSEKFVTAIEPDFFDYVDADKTLKDADKARYRAAFDAYKSCIQEHKKWYK